jgi:hypothetical protein
LDKAYIASGLGVAACRQDHRARFYTDAQSVNELQEASTISTTQILGAELAQPACHSR